MATVSTYLVCKNRIQETRMFLKDFFEEEVGRFNHTEWITFKIPHSNFTINLMKGENQPQTQNITFELNCTSMDELKQYATKYDKEIRNFLAEQTGKPYRFHYIEILGPNDICKIDVSYCEELVE